MYSELVEQDPWARSIGWPLTLSHSSKDFQVPDLVTDQGQSGFPLGFCPTKTVVKC